MNNRKRKSGYERFQENIRGLKTPKIEVWQNKYPDKEYSINLEVPEFTCICPPITTSPITTRLVIMVMEFT